MGWSGFLCPLLIFAGVVWLIVRLARDPDRGRGLGLSILGAFVGVLTGMAVGCAGALYWVLPRLPPNDKGGGAGLGMILMGFFGLVLGGAYGAAAGGVIGASRFRYGLGVALIPPAVVGIWLYAENAPVRKQAALVKAIEKLGATAAVAPQAPIIEQRIYGVNNVSTEAGLKELNRFLRFFRIERLDFLKKRTGFALLKLGKNLREESHVHQLTVSRVRHSRLRVLPNGLH